LSASICKETKDDNSLCVIYNNLGILADTRGNSNKALEYFFSALIIIEKTSNKILLSTTYNNIGDTYRNMNQTEKALEYFYKCLKVSEEIGDKSLIGTVNENIGLIYFESKTPRLNAALSYLLKSLTYYQKLGDINSMAGIYPPIIEIYIARKDYPKASKILKKGLELSKEVESIEIQAELHRAASEYYFATKDYAKSLEQSRLGIRFARKGGDIPILIPNLKQNSTVAAKLNLHKEAYNSILEYNVLKDSVQYQTEKKNLFLKEFQYKEANLKLEQLKKELILKKESETRKWIYSGVILGLVFLLFYAIMISRNLKRQKEYSKGLKEINNTKDKLFSIISHDLRNPFNTILGFSELLMNNIEEINPVKVKKIAATLYKSSKSTYDLLERLLQWSALQSNKIVYAPEKVDLKALIVGNIEMVTPLAAQKQIQIIDLTGNSQSVFADQNMLNTVIINLLTNAIKFTFTGGKIEISSTVKDNMLFLSIKDNGQGISAQKLKDLFNFCAFTSSKGTNNESGTGLGLILCKEFIEKNKGELLIESEEGKGSNFIISIPLIS
jgi:signal transduction histidine kinase